MPYIPLATRFFSLRSLLASMDTPQPQTPVPMRLEHQISWKGRYAETKAVEVKKTQKYLRDLNCE